MPRLLYPAWKGRHDRCAYRLRHALGVDGDTIKCDGVNMRDMGDGLASTAGHALCLRRVWQSMRVASNPPTTKRENTLARHFSKGRAVNYARDSQTWKQ